MFGWSDLISDRCFCQDTEKVHWNEEVPSEESTSSAIQIAHHRGPMDENNNPTVNKVV